MSRRPFRRRHRNVTDPSTAWKIRRFRYQATVLGQGCNASRGIGGTDGKGNAAYCSQFRIATIQVSIWWNVFATYCLMQIPPRAERFDRRFAATYCQGCRHGRRTHVLVSRLQHAHEQSGGSPLKEVTTRPGARDEDEAGNLKLIKLIPMGKPVEKYNGYNKITLSPGAGHRVGPRGRFPVIRGRLATPGRRGFAH